MQPRDSNYEKVSIRPLSGNLYLVEDFNYWKTNSVFYTGKEGVYFFGTGWTHKSGRQILWKAKTLTLKEFLGVFLVSPELDFSGGIHEFRYEENIKIYLQGEGILFLYDNWKNWQKKWRQSFSTWIVEDVPAIDGALSRTVLLDGGNIIMKYPGPVLVPGNMVVVFTAEKTLYGGNLFHDPEEFRLFFPDKKNLFLFVSFLHEIEKETFEKVISGKGSPLHNRKLIKKMIEYYGKQL